MLKSALVTASRDASFEPFDILANPLGEWGAADRESRIFRREGAGLGCGTCYGSHALYLMRRKGASPRDRELFVAVHHGGGREIWEIPACFNYAEETAAALQAMPERALYSLLWGIVDALGDTRRAAIEGTAADWRRATLDKRVKVSRQPARGRAFVWIEPERQADETDSQHELRKALAKPSGVR